MMTQLTFPLILAAGGEDPTSGLLTWGPLVAIGVLFYFMLIRPERQKKKDMTDMLSKIKKNDRVVTIGGILASVASAPKESEEVTLKIDENNNTKIRVLRSSIARVLSDQSTSDKTE